MKQPDLPVQPDDVKPFLTHVIAKHLLSTMKALEENKSIPKGSAAMFQSEMMYAFETLEKSTHITK